MKNIGIITWLSIRNYGSILQNYALQAYLKSLNCNPTTIIHKQMLENSIKLVEQTSYKKLKFINDNINIKYYNSTNDINEYDILCCGGDQIWANKEWVEPNCALLNINTEKKVSYAPSFGSRSLPFDEDTIKALNDFSYISCREKCGINLLNNVGISAQQVIDPVFLIDDYPCEKVNCAPFDFAYIIHSDPSKYLKDNCLCFNWKMSVEEWLWKIKNCRTLITDSFHGCCFKVMFGGNLFAIDDNSSRFDIFYDWGLENCFKKPSVITADWDKINELKESSKQYIKSWIE